MAKLPVLIVKLDPAFRLLGDLLADSEREVQTLREALRELAGAAVTDCDPSGRPFEPGEFHEHVQHVATAALGAYLDEPEADGDFFNGPPTYGDALDAETHGDGETDPNYCEDCDGPCSI